MTDDPSTAYLGQEEEEEGPVHEYEEEGTQRGTGSGWKVGAMGESRTGEMNSHGRTDGRMDGWRLRFVYWQPPSPPLPRESNGGWHIRGLLGKLMEMI
jgi:hypothetical protein